MKKYILSIFLLFITFISYSQTIFKGMIMSKDNPKNNLGVPDVTVYWLNTNVSAITNSKGWFEIAYKKEYTKLIVSHVGYKTDTLEIKDLIPIHHFLTPDSKLEEVVLVSEKQATQRAFFSSQNTFTVNKQELLKAACCNLAESFETNPSIDVNFTDALTGTRQIAMLGLTSPYLLITEENIPTIRGASQVYGLSFVPGTWVESIQVTKGAGSAVNGFESISGQINTELVKPFSDHQFFANTYASINGRLESNLHFNKIFSEKWQVGLYVHGNKRGKKLDSNGDNFLDMPLANQINIMNRWQFTNAKKGWIGFFNIKYLNDQKQTGEVTFNPSIDKGTTNAWGSEVISERFDTSIKLSYVFPELPYQKISFQAAYSNHDQESYFGLRNYSIKHESAYTNLLFNSIIGDTRNSFKTGVSFSYDRYNELVNFVNYNRIERSLGGFFEYAFNNLDDFSLTAGLRLDTHNLLGTFITPRLHVRYEPWEKSILKASIGRGKRSANIFAENQQLFSSNRSIEIISNQQGVIYGLQPEIAWNYGLSFTQKFQFFSRYGDITFDLYQTNFQEQVVVDWENTQQVSFYNLEGKSIANSFQVEVNYKILKNVAIRTAYKCFDVAIDYKHGNFQKPLLPRHRFFVNLSYDTKTKENDAQWKFDATFNALGKQRLPNTKFNDFDTDLPDFSKPFQTINFQITKVFSKQFEVYAGGENITNVQQVNPVLGSNNPFGNSFDASIIYAPIFGSAIYTGLRYKFK